MTGIVGSPGITRIPANGQFVGEDGKNYAVVACVLRNTGSGWYAIEGVENGTLHGAMNVASVGTGAGVNHITVNFTFNAKKVISFVACPDETFVGLGYSFGASVGTNQALIEIGYQTSIGGSLTWNGTSWSLQYAPGFTSATYSNGVLQLNHANITGYQAYAISRDGTYVPALSTVTGTYTQVKLFDWAGTLVTTPSTNAQIYVVRMQPPTNISDVSTVSPAGSNIWCYGVFEI